LKSDTFGLAVCALFKMMRPIGTHKLPKCVIFTPNHGSGKRTVLDI
jgi:hypothetical protein